MSPRPGSRNMFGPKKITGTDRRRTHLDWLSLVDIAGPFLSLPVLVDTWPDLNAIDGTDAERLRRAHDEWQRPGPGTSSAEATQGWLDYLFGELLDWRTDLHWDTEAVPELPVPAYDTVLRPDFVLTEPGEQPGPKNLRLLGLYTPGTHPARRVKDDPWAATPIDRVAQLCRHHDVPLGIATDGRFVALVYAPPRKVSASVVFDTVTWNENSERTVVRAFTSLLERRRFFTYEDDKQLPRLFEKSAENGEEITEALGVQVRRAVELLAEAIGRTDVRVGSEVNADEVPAQDVYRGAVAVMMRLVFLLFAEERGLLPVGNKLYDDAYSAAGLCKELEERAVAGTENELETQYGSWQRLLALFTAVNTGVEHPELTMPAYGGSIFDPRQYWWMQDPERPLPIDDRTVLHMLTSVMYVETGTGKAKERRQLSFKALDVEQIGYVYEGLLSFVGKRALDTVVGLVGKAGMEEEVDLSELEEYARLHPDLADLAVALHEKYDKERKSGLGSKKKIEGALRGIIEGTEEVRTEALRQLLAVTNGDRELAERLVPWSGLIRLDLRGLPTVVLPGALYVTESSLRKNTGTHYTPRTLAEEVVEGALEPLVYEPGPLQTADESTWKRKSSKEILALKVADIAMGSGAFLVAACRYMAKHLIEAWTAEDSPKVHELERDAASIVDDESDPVTVKARRLVIEHCLYGVDINPMAVEMAKLSLWLVSMDNKRPFTFLDDRLVAGDSLLGITSVDQVRYMHLDPTEGQKLHGPMLEDLTEGIRERLKLAAEKRRELADIAGDDLEALHRKQDLLNEVRAYGTEAKVYANLVVGAGLASHYRKAGGKLEGEGREDLFRLAADYASKNDYEASDHAERWLSLDMPEGGFARKPLHWPLEFPEVFELGGFDGIIGNPPFLGGLKISASLGTSYKEKLVAEIGSGVRGTRGTCDLVAYFALRSTELTNDAGQLGIVATNTLAQGDTREVGLDKICRSGPEIRMAIKSQPWPSRSAVLEYCAVWISNSSLADTAKKVLDGRRVAGITSSLHETSRTEASAARLTANRDRCFQGYNILGLGFTLPSAEAQEILGRDAEYQRVLFPYLSGQDLNSKADYSASRWVINFHDWPESEAAKFPECYEQVRRLVMPHRLTNKVKSRREKWWQYSEYRRGLVQATQGLGRAILIARVSKTIMPVLALNGQVFSEQIVVFGSDDFGLFALLSSASHYWWAISRASTMKGDLRYTPSDVFETLARPELTEELRRLGERLDSERRELMLSRQAGLTATYNLVHDQSCRDSDIVNLREIHRLIDFEVCRAYDWDGLIESLNHGHHDTPQGERYTVDAVARQEILDRLLELNQARYAEEVAAGLHDKKAAAKKKAATKAKKKPPVDEGSTLF